MSSPKNKSKEESQIAKTFLERQDDILGRVITGNERLVYQYDPEVKRKSANGRLPISHDQKNVADFF
jgi:hypothetical protein